MSMIETIERLKMDADLLDAYAASDRASDFEADQAEGKASGIRHAIQAVEAALSEEGAG